MIETGTDTIQYVTLKKLAQEFGMDKGNLRKYVRRMGFDPVKIRTAESRRQLTSALTESDAEAVRELRESQGFITTVPISDGDGSFYVAQIVPDLDPSRIKLGFARDADARLRAHKTSAPTARLLKVWPCKRVWERAAIDCAASHSCAPISNEVFSCQDLESLLGACDDFFGLMPQL